MQSQYPRAEAELPALVTSQKQSVGICEEDSKSSDGGRLQWAIEVWAAYFYYNYVGIPRLVEIAASLCCPAGRGRNPHVIAQEQQQLEATRNQCAYVSRKLRWLWARQRETNDIKENRSSELRVACSVIGLQSISGNYGAAASGAKA